MTTDFEHQCRLVAFDCDQSIRRASRAFHYMNGTLDAGEANDIIHDCQPIAGWYPLETFNEESLLDTILLDYEFNNHPALESLVHQACERVWHKWESTGDAGAVAEDWALDLVMEYAAEDGVELNPIAEEAA